MLDRILPAALVVASFVFSAGVWYAKLEVAELRAQVRVIDARLSYIEQSLRRLEGRPAADEASYAADAR